MAYELSSSHSISSEGSNLKKIKESFHSAYSSKEWRKKALPVWLSFVVVIGAIIWAVLICTSPSRLIMGSLGSCDANTLDSEKYLKIRSKQFRSSLFSGTDQALCLLNHGFAEPNGRVNNDMESKRQCPIEDRLFFPKVECMLTEANMPDRFDSALSTSVEEHLSCDKKRRISDQDQNGVWLTAVKTYWYAVAGIIVMLSGGTIAPWLKENRKSLHFEPGPLQRHHLLLLKQQQLTQQMPKRSSKWQKKLLVMFVLLGIMSSIWLFLVLFQNTARRRKETLASMCDERAQMLQDQFNVSMNHVHTLATLVSTFHHGKSPSVVDQMTFAEYTKRTAFERPLTSGVAYSVKVLHSERESFEKLQGWTIKKTDFSDQTLVQDWILEKLDTAPPQDEYAPVIFSQDTVSHIVSIDMMSGKEDRENILRARASGKGALTSPFKLLKSNRIGVVLTFAVYNTDVPLDATPEQRIQASVGYLGASYDVPSLVEKLLEQFSNKQTIVVDVYDTTNATYPVLMYSGGDVVDLSLVHVSDLDFGDPLRTHQIHCRFKQKAALPWTAIYPSAVLLVIILLVGHVFHAPIRRIAEAEAGYCKMLELKVRAEAADVAKSQFLATISHEIRTPMNGVLGMLQMLMDTDLDKIQMDYAVTAHTSGKELISLINDVLDQAKIESGKLELEAVPFNLHSVLDNVLSLFSRRSNEKGIELAAYVSKHVPDVVVGDPGRFRQIIQNLVGNSIKFTPDKGGHVFVTVHMLEEISWQPDAQDVVLQQASPCLDDSTRKLLGTLSGIRVVDRWRSWENLKRLLINESDVIQLLITIEDTGVGISQEAQNSIFTPFVQGDSSTSRTYGGTGIGLSICKCLVDLMKGDIGFYSEANVGTAFSLVVSFRKGEANLIDAKLPSHDLSVKEFQGWRALIVDNRSIRAEVTKYHLRKLGVLSDTVASLKLACSYLTTGPGESFWTKLAMVLIEQETWEEDSAAMLQTILKARKSKNGGQIPVIPKVLLLATTISLEEQAELKSPRLYDRILLKPLRVSVLLSYVQEGLGSKKNSGMNKNHHPPLRSLVKGKRILVVDDNMVNRRVAEGALKKHGAIVTCVNNGLEAVKLLKPPHEFDACFMDKRMPEMDGLEATRQIRSTEKLINDEIASGKVSAKMFADISRWHTPILAMTADSIHGTNEEWLKCGMDDFVSKPFEEEQLYLALARIFNSSCSPSS